MRRGICVPSPIPPSEEATYATRNGDGSNRMYAGRGDLGHAQTSVRHGMHVVHGLLSHAVELQRYVRLSDLGLLGALGRLPGLGRRVAHDEG